MKVVITGGGGFLGHRLALSLLERGWLTGVSGGKEAIDEMVLFDVGFGPHSAEAFGGREKVRCVEGDIADADRVSAVIDRDDVSVFHLASMVSGECEERFEDAMRVNLDGGRNVLEACRLRGSAPRVVFASSIAAFGGEVMPERVGDGTKRTPQTTYGMTKVIGELMINDYTRKGFIDGRSARLPTVVVRPGKPNTAASSFASGLFREPLAGKVCELPVERSQLVPVIGYRSVVESFIGLHEAAPDRLGDDRAYGLPSLRVTVGEMIEALEKVAKEKGIVLGKIVDAPDAVIRRIVATWPTATDGSRALELGLPEDESVESIVGEYLEDYG